MNHTLLVGAVTLLIGFGSADLAWAAVQRGQATLSWIAIGASARDAAMGGTAVFTDQDASAAFQNPAGLGRLQRGNVFVNRTQWLADMAINDIAVAYRLPNIGTLAVAVRTIDYGEFKFTAIDATNPQGYRDLPADTVGTPGGFVVGLAYGRKLTDKFTVGGQVKYASDRLGKMNVLEQQTVKTGSEAKISGFLLDFGTNYNTGFKSLNISMAIQNFGSEKGASNGRGEFTAPLTFKVGLSANVLEFAGMEDAPMSLLVRAEGTDPRDAREGLNLGTELKFMPMSGIYAAARAGMATRQDDGGMSFGLGVGGTVGPVQAAVDYAYSDYGSILGGVNRIGVSVSF